MWILPNGEVALFYQEGTILVSHVKSRTTESSCHKRILKRGMKAASRRRQRAIVAHCRFRSQLLGHSAFKPNVSTKIISTHPQCLGSIISEM